jgi:hypothetical protein
VSCVREEVSAHQVTGPGALDPYRKVGSAFFNIDPRVKRALNLGQSQRRPGGRTDHPLGDNGLVRSAPFQPTARDSNPDPTRREPPAGPGNLKSSCLSFPPRSEVDTGELLCTCQP